MAGRDFYKGRKILVTGHTGFKGSWMCRILLSLGADVIGYSIEPPTTPSLYDLSEVNPGITSILGDIRDNDKLLETFKEYRPEVVIHMAAQPLVGIGYEDPRYTYETNVMGTVNVLEAIRRTDSVRSFLNVTTDKVYLNKEWMWGYRENEELDGFDPYSNSKSCSELVTHCYSKSYPRSDLAISTARAGNVIGGGDFTDPRIIPDCMRAALNDTKVILRNPKATRPYQHVLEPVCAYLMIAEKQYHSPELAGSYNVGPEDESCIDNESLVRLFCEKYGPGVSYEVHQNPNAPHEANYLKLDISKIKSVLGWRPVWTIDTAVEKTVEWIKAYRDSRSIPGIMDRQIEEYLCRMEW